MTTKILCSLLAVGVLAAAAARTITPRDLVGTYQVTGTNPDGSRYSGEMTLTMKKGTLSVSGRIGEGQEFYGLARLLDDKLALSYGISQQDTGAMSFINLILYKVKKTGARIKLDGIWSYGDGIGQERAEKD